MRELGKQVKKAETAISRFQKQIAEIDATLAQPPAGSSIAELAKRRAGLCGELETLEAQWLTLTERIEA